MQKEQEDLVKIVNTCDDKTFEGIRKMIADERNKYDNVLKLMSERIIAKAYEETKEKNKEKKKATMEEEITIRKGTTSVSSENPSRTFAVQPLVFGIGPYMLKMQ